jgi:integrase
MAHRSWGAVRKLPSGRYQAKYRVNGVLTPAPNTFPNKAQADRWLSSKQAEIDRGDAVDEKAGARTLSSWWPDYERSIAGLRASTCSGYKAAWRLRIRPAFGDRPVRRIKATDIDDWLLRLRDRGVSAGKITEAYGVLSRLLDRAVRDRAIARNPCGQRTEKLPKRAPTERPVLSPADVETLVKPMATVLDRLAVRLMAYGGLRIGEVLGLRWEDIDTDRKTLTVRRTIGDSTGKLVVEPPKNGIIRTITLPDSLSNQLESARSTGVVYPNARGSYRRYRNWRRDVWDGAVKASGITALPHDLRATCASLLIDAGASPKDVQTHLGHADVTTTLALYARVRPGRSELIASKLDALIGEA